jgi:hypothetical protein
MIGWVCLGVYAFYNIYEPEFFHDYSSNLLFVVNNIVRVGVAIQLPYHLRQT